MREINEIQVLAAYEYGYCRSIVRGVARRRRTGSRCLVRFTSLPDDYDFSSMVGRGIALIVMAGKQEVQELILKCGIPAVNISGKVEEPALPTVVPDNVAVGRMAAEHLLDTGVMHFVYYAMPGNHFSDLRGLGFRKVIEERGFTCEEYAGSATDLVRNFLPKMPKPLGVFVPTDRMASRTLHYLLNAQVRVPEEIAVIGVDNDDIECPIATPPLSSVDVAAERVGYEAAVLLERMVQKKEMPKSPVLIQPLGVVARESTDLMAVTDPDLSAVLRYIRDNATSNLTVAEVLDRSVVSRRSLEMKFRKRFGRSLLQEITRVKVRRARYLLHTTDQKVESIATSVGFSGLRSFQKAFQLATGKSPRDFRNHYRFTDDRKVI